jgi:hypothetical protein
MPTNRTSFQTSVIELAFRYWSSKRVGGRLTSRRDVRPEEIPQLLPHVFLVDVRHAPLGFRFRLVGTEICRLAAREYTGAWVNERDYGPNWRSVFDDYERVVRTAKPDLATCRAPWLGREFVVYERLLAPLSGDGTTVDMLFGALHPIAQSTAKRPRQRSQS